MKSDSPLVSRLFLGLCTLSVLGFAVTWMQQRTDWIGPALAASAVALALAASTGRGSLRQMAFTIWIVTGVVVGMTFHKWFITFPSNWYGLGGREMSVVFIPVLQIIMFAIFRWFNAFSPRSAASALLSFRLV